MKRPNPENAPRAVRASRKFYGWLLNFYPKGHRREFGLRMSQLFSDTALDAWNQGKSLGLAALWLRTVPDFFKTVVIEHLATLKGSPAMSPSTKPLKTVFLATAATVCALLCCVLLATLWLQPKRYRSIAMVELQNTDLSAKGNTAYINELNHLACLGVGGTNGLPDVLDEVVASLDLRKKFAQTLGVSTMTGDEARPALRGLLWVTTPAPPPPFVVIGTNRPTGGVATLFEIHAFNRDNQLAADIANKVVEVYASNAQQRGFTVRIVNSGKVATDPTSPNMPLNLAIGIPVAAIVGCIVGAVLCLALWVWRRLKAKPAANEASPSMPS